MSRNEKNRKWFVMITAVLVCFAFEGATLADIEWGYGEPIFVTQRQKFLASDGATGDIFGYSVSISGDYIIVGAYNDDDKGSSSGSAYIFKWEGTSWVEQQKLLASDGAADDYFSCSVSISGDYAIVGARYDDDKGSGSGSAYIFRREGTSWVEQAKLLASDGADGDVFGCSVAIGGDYAIVGAYGDDDKGSSSGSVYIFKRDGASWNQQAKLTASDGAASDYFGCSVSISGDYAVIGAYNDDGGYGSAYIFKRDGASWSQQDKLIDSDGGAGDYFGSSVSISGDYAIVGAYFNDYKGIDSGSAYIFKRDGTIWIKQQKFLASDGSSSDYFGCSVSISVDCAVVGAYGNDDKGGGSGSAYVFWFYPAADLDENRRVDFTDFAIFADWWLYGTD